MPITPAPTTTMVSGTRSSSQDAVGVDDARLVELHVGGSSRLGARGDHDLLRGDHTMLAAAVDLHRMGIDEASGADEQVDVVAEQLRPHDLDLPADHMLRAGQQVP